MSDKSARESGGQRPISRTNMKTVEADLEKPQNSAIRAVNE
tara:strand:- start:363 stop:485 length:123 start_codon:yes stop_codon:yes gene_type:complete